MADKSGAQDVTVRGSGASGASDPSDNPVKVGGRYNATPLALTDGQRGDMAISPRAEQLTAYGAVTPVTAVYTSATAGNTALSLTVTGLNTVIVSFTTTGTVTQGGFTFEVDDGSGQWQQIQGVRVVSGSTEYAESSANFAYGGGTMAWQFNVAGFTTFRLRLSQVILGSGSLNFRISGSAAVSVASLFATVLPISIVGTSVATTNPYVAGARATQAAPAATADGNSVVPQADAYGRLVTIPVAADNVGTTLSAANATVTLTLASPGAGLRHYITRIKIINLNPTVTAIAAAASTLSYTTTNLPGSLTWSVGTLLAAGAEKTVEDVSFAMPLKSSAQGTATTIVAPAIGAGGLCRITAYYFIAP